MQGPHIASLHRVIYCTKCGKRLHIMAELLRLYLTSVCCFRTTLFAQWRTDTSWLPRGGLLPQSMSPVLTLLISSELVGIFSSRGVRYEGFVMGGILG